MAPESRNASKSLWQGMQDLQLGASPQAVARKLSFTEDLAHKLCLEATLHGHTGCVNRLAWSEDGTQLVSGSDDRSMRVWRYTGDGAQEPLVVDTLHQGNIFGIAFLPATDNRELVSGAMDYSVQHHVMEGGAHAAQSAGSPVRNGRSRAHPSSSQHSVSCRTTSYTPHKGRIKDVEVAPGNPNQFWSASEDGSIREYDKRCTTASQRDYSSANVLVEVTNKGRPVELKSVAVNRVRPHQMAVAAGDCYLRIYDRRMLALTQPSSASPTPVLSLTPPHLSSGSPRQRNSVPHGTYVQFGNRGDKLVATYHGDHAYSFDVTASEQPPVAAFRLPPPDEARAGALQQRSWIGDAAFALRDCECALALDMHHPDAMLLRAQLLLQLGQLEAALQAAEACEEAHPGLDEDVARVYDGIERATDERRKELEERAAAAARRQMAVHGDAPQSADTTDTPSESSSDSQQPPGRSPTAERSEAAPQPGVPSAASDDPVAAEGQQQ